MNLHSLQNCISLAESFPQDDAYYLVRAELLRELRYLAKKAENA